MKTKLLLKSFFAFAFLLGCHLAEAQVLWYGDPNEDVRTVFRRLDPDGNRNPTGDRCVDDPNNPPTVSTPTDGSFGKFWRITKPRNRKRAEFARTNGFIPQEGQDYYIGWRWRVNASPNLNDGIAVFQWKSDPGGNDDSNKQNYPFNMGYDGNELTINAYGPAEPNWNRPGSINQRKTTIWKGQVSEGQWVSLVFRVNVDRDFDSSNGRYRGFIEFWFNGSKQTLMNSGFDEYQVVLSGDRKRAYHRTNDGSQVYTKWGSYNENACDYEVITDFDDMRVAETYDEARPTPAGSGGGGGGGSNKDLAGTYTFKNVATGQYLDSNGTTIVTGSSNSGSDKQWRLVESASGFYNIDNQFSGRGVLDTDGNKVVKGTSIQPVTTNDDREWSAESLGGNVYRFKNRFSGRGYLAARTSDGGVEHTSWDGKRAQWELRRVGSSLKANIVSAEGAEIGIAAQNEVENMTLYPNPATNTISINSGQVTGSKAKIYNVGGNEVLSAAITKEARQTDFDISTLPKGVYVLEVEVNGETVRRKFIKN